MEEDTKKPYIYGEDYSSLWQTPKLHSVPWKDGQYKALITPVSVTEFGFMFAGWVSFTIIGAILFGQSVKMILAGMVGFIIGFAISKIPTYRNRSIINNSKSILLLFIPKTIENGQTRFGKTLKTFWVEKKIFFRLPKNNRRT